MVAPGHVWKLGLFRKGAAYLYMGLKIVDSKILLGRNYRNE